MGSFEKLIVDAEMLQMMAEYMRPIEVNDDTMALQAIADKNAAAGNTDPLPVPDYTSDDFLQSVVFAIGKNHGFEPLRAWFGCLYEVLMGATEGPRFGGFIALYGIPETIALIDKALTGDLIA